MQNKLCFKIFFFLVCLTASNSIYSEKLLIFSNAPYILDNGYWKNYFNTKNWKKSETLEADPSHLFIYLNPSRLPREMNRTKSSWGLWDIKKNTFLPIESIPSSFTPIRLIGNRIFVRNENSTHFAFIDEDKNKIETIIKSSHIRGWYPRYDGSIAFIAQAEDCEKNLRFAQSVFSICIIEPTFDKISKVGELNSSVNPMLTGTKDSHILTWTFDKKENIWDLRSINLGNGEVAVIYKTVSTIRKDTIVSPKWLSWIDSNWVVYEYIKPAILSVNNPPQEEPKSNPNRTFILHNFISGQKKEILLEQGGKILQEPGNEKFRQFQYNPYLITLDYESKDGLIKVIDAKELKIVLETKFPLPKNPQSPELSTFYP